MKNDKQVRSLFQLMSEGKTQEQAALKTEMSSRTARRYLHLEQLPSECQSPRYWRTRQDPFHEVWDEVVEFFRDDPLLEAKTIFEWLQQQYPGRFSDGQLRTFQRRVKEWRAQYGPPKEVFFPQENPAGERAQIDFTEMKELGITINGEPFSHLLFHFRLPYSGWESVSVCFSESFESLTEGIQTALWRLGGAPQYLQTDSLSAAVHQDRSEGKFTDRYEALLRHYGIAAQTSNPYKPHENGSAEKSHGDLKRRLDQALRLRGHRDFSSRREYEKFLQSQVSHINHNRQTGLQEEKRHLKPLPQTKLESYTRCQIRVTQNSTIRVKKNIYSVDSRLIGEIVDVRMKSETIEVWYAQKLQETLPRLRGRGNHYVQYRHIIDWLVRKPEAFTNYCYKQDLFPTHRFRMAYDDLRCHSPSMANKEYTQILELAAKEGEDLTDRALQWLFEQGVPITLSNVKDLIKHDPPDISDFDPKVAPVELNLYNNLISGGIYES